MFTFVMFYRLRKLALFDASTIENIDKICKYYGRLIEVFNLWEINISFQLVSQFPLKYTVVLYCECIMSDMKNKYGLN